MKEMKTRQVSLGDWQTERLLRYCATYRRCLVQGQTPSLRRNQVLRATQMVQARLSHWAGGSPGEGQTLVLSQQESHTLRLVVVGLLRQQRTTRPCEQRRVLIAELADTLVLLHRGEPSLGEHRQ